MAAWFTTQDAWGLIGMGSVVCGLVFLLWYMSHDRDSPFSISESLTDPTTGHTSYLRTIVFCSFVGAWALALGDWLRGRDVQTFVLAILGIFVTNVLGTRFFENSDPRVKAQAFIAAPDMPAEVLPAPDPAPATATATVNVSPPEVVAAKSRKTKGA